MTIHYEMGSIFLTGAQTIINTVNCVGIMGKGLALQFKEREPDMFNKYERVCAKGTLRPGMIWPYRNKHNELILNCAVKDHWRKPSQVKWVVSCCEKIVEHHERLGITSLAVPHMGCGAGGLDWHGQVHDIIVPILRNLPFDVFIVSPDGH